MSASWEVASTTQISRSCAAETGTLATQVADHIEADIAHLGLTFRNHHVPAIRAEAGTDGAPRSPARGTRAGAFGTPWASATGGADTAAAVADNKLAGEEARSAAGSRASCAEGSWRYGCYWLI